MQGVSVSMAELRRVCVFCGSSPGADPAYADAARELGEELLRREMGLVYGGGNVGLMGIVADTVLAGGGEVLGAIPARLVEHEVAHEGLTELVVVDDMFERKAYMMERADAFVSLPGGVGTLDELFEVLTWVQLGYLAKPCALLDVNGYWDPLVALLDSAVQNGFMRPQHRKLLLRASSAREVLDMASAWAPPGSEGD
jgi:uncharacterized protein (TIGR00730 family)